MSVEPEIPPEVLARQNAKLALSPMAAEELGQQYAERPLDAFTKKNAPKLGRPKKKPGRRPKAEESANNASSVEEHSDDANPLAGMTREQIEVVRSRNYPDLPKMDPMQGDWTPSFYKAIWEKYPKDAAIRYYARDISL